MKTWKEYEENFTPLRKRYPQVARWLENSSNEKAIMTEQAAKILEE